MQTRAPHAGANARLQFLLEIYRACLIISNRTTLRNHFSIKILSRKRGITVPKIF